MHFYEDFQIIGPFKQFLVIYQKKLTKNVIKTYALVTLTLQWHEIQKNSKRPAKKL